MSTFGPPLPPLSGKFPDYTVFFLLKASLRWFLLYWVKNLSQNKFYCMFMINQMENIRFNSWNGFAYISGTIYCSFIALASCVLVWFSIASTSMNLFGPHQHLGCGTNTCFGSSSMFSRDIRHNLGSSWRLFASILIACS